MHLRTTAVGALAALALSACSTASGIPTSTSGTASPGGSTSATSAGTSSASSASASSSPALTAFPRLDYRVLHSVPVPGDGPLASAGAMLWAVDRKDAAEDAAGRLDGDVWVVDPAEAKVAARIPHARGGFPATGLGAVWLVQAEFGETVMRIDLRTHRAVRFRTSSTHDPAPEALAVSDGALWVGNNHDGTAVRVDPRTLRVTATVQVSAGPGVRGHATADDRYVWMPSDDDQSVVRIDARTAQVVSRLALPRPQHPARPERDQASMSNPEWLELVDGNLWVATFDHLYVVDVSTVGAEHVVDDVALPGMSPLLLAVAPDAVWGVSGDPQVLLRLDRRTHQVIGALPLDQAQYMGGSSPYPAIAGRSLWLRLKDRVVELGSSAT